MDKQTLCDFDVSECPFALRCTKNECRLLKEYNILADRLEKAKELKAEGMLITPPCRIGDAIWAVLFDRTTGVADILEGVVQKISIDILSTGRFVSIRAKFPNNKIFNRAASFYSFTYDEAVKRRDTILGLLT